jgi:hypothetical protein
LNYFSDLFSTHYLSLLVIMYIIKKIYATAAAPPTISDISLVIAACLALL